MRDGHSGEAVQIGPQPKAVNCYEILRADRYEYHAMIKIRIITYCNGLAVTVSRSVPPSRIRYGVGRRNGSACVEHAMAPAANSAGGDQRRWACSRSARPGSASVRERWSMASDPELPRFGASIARLHEDGQSSNVHRVRGGRNAFPWQHLSLVLRFVCEFGDCLLQG
jgi:hypothetical protein